MLVNKSIVIVKNNFFFKKCWNSSLVSHNIVVNNSGEKIKPKLQYKEQYINIFIDNLYVLVKKGTTILQSCLSLENKIDTSKKIIPRFCYHQELNIAGNCRMCLVELQQSIKPVVSCAFEVNSNMSVYTNTVLIKKAREGILEFLLSNHPLDCPVCDQGGECDLQEQAEVFGKDRSRFNEYKRAISFKTCSPFIKMVMTRCIHCTRCIRFLVEIAGSNSFGLLGRGNNMEVGNFIIKNINNELSGNIIDLCPVGALTSKISNFEKRSWEFIEYETVDILENSCADLKIGTLSNKIVRVLPRFNKYINSYWITDNTRFSIDGLKINRYLTPMLNTNLVKIDELKKNISLNLEKKKISSISYQELINFLFKYNDVIFNILKKKINYSFYLGEFSDSKSSIAVKHLGNILGSSFIESRVNSGHYFNLDTRKNYLLNISKKLFNKINLFILLGVNIRLEAPLYNIKIRKLLKKNILIISFSSTASMFYYVKHVGLGSKLFLKFLEGKHYLANFLINQKIKIDFYNTLILLGNSILIRKDANSIINAINFYKNKINSNVYFGVIQNYVGNITANEIGIMPGINYFNNNNTLFNKNISNVLSNPLNYIIALQCENLNFNKKLNNVTNKFLLNIGANSISHSFFDLILPSAYIYEKKTSYINLEGCLRQTNKIIDPSNSNILSEWLIIFLLYFTFFTLNNNYKYYISNLNSKYNYRYFLFNNYYFFKLFNLMNKNKKLQNNKYYLNNIYYHFNNKLINNVIYKYLLKNNISSYKNYFNNVNIYNISYYNLINNFLFFKKLLISIFNSKYFFNNIKNICFNFILANFNYFNNNNISSNNLFLNSKIDNILYNSLIKHSYLFNNTNQYYLLLNNEFEFNYNNNNNNFDSYLIYNYPFSSFIDNYYQANNLSKLSPNLIRKSYLDNLRYTNYL